MARKTPGKLDIKFIEARLGNTSRPNDEPPIGFAKKPCIGLLKGKPVWIKRNSILPPKNKDRKPNPNTTQPVRPPKQDDQDSDYLEFITPPRSPQTPDPAPKPRRTPPPEPEARPFRNFENKENSAGSVSPSVAHAQEQQDLPFRPLSRNRPLSRVEIGGTIYKLVPLPNVKEESFPGSTPSKTKGDELGRLSELDVDVPIPSSLSSSDIEEPQRSGKVGDFYQEPIYNTGKIEEFYSDDCDDEPEEAEYDNICTMIDAQFVLQPDSSDEEGDFETRGSAKGIAGPGDT